MTPLDRLAQRQLVVLTGKGGTGKTAVTAGLGRALAARGRRVLLVESDPRENLHEMFAVPPSGGELVAVGDRIWLQNVQPTRVIEELVREQLRIDMLARRVVASPVYEHFVQGAPGIKELALLGHGLRRFEHGGGPERIEVILLDAPATGHGLALLAAPRLVSGTVRTGPFGDLAGRLAAWIDDPSTTGVVVVTRAEEMPAQEALEMIASLRTRLDREPDALVINALWPDGPVRPFACRPDWETLVELWTTRRAINAREGARLAAGWDGPRIEVPYLPLERGPELAAALQSAFERWGEAAG